ncbi:hypothetical protein KCV07_g215, partial [Aureobasidium melanogenum]
MILGLITIAHLLHDTVLDRQQSHHAPFPVGPCSFVPIRILTSNTKALPPLIAYTRKQSMKRKENEIKHKRRGTEFKRRYDLTKAGCSLSSIVPAESHHHQRLVRYALKIKRADDLSNDTRDLSLKGATSATKATSIRQMSAAKKRCGFPKPTAKDRSGNLHMQQHGKLQNVASPIVMIKEIMVNDKD